MAPANSHGVRAQYFPGAPVIDKSPQGQGFKSAWSGMWPRIISGEIQTHSFENAPITAAKGRPS